MLLTHIREVADEPLVIDPAARDEEIRENTWSLSVSVDERGSLSAAEVVLAFEACAAVLRERVRSLGHEGSATFYVWHDEQAGRLRCSTGSVSRDRLPFRTAVELDVPLTAIVEAFLADPSPGRIAWEDLDDVPDGAADDAQQQDGVVRVWTAEVGRTTRAH